MELELLKIGDKLYHKGHQRYGDNIYYSFSEVVRLTKTQAILSNGTKLINEPIYDHYNKKVGYSVYGDRWRKWHIETNEIVEAAKKEKERQFINHWFEKTKFTEEQKSIIYKTLKELNKLENNQN